MTFEERMDQMREEIAASGCGCDNPWCSWRMLRECVDMLDEILSRVYEHAVCQDIPCGFHDEVDILMRDEPPEPA